jgi:hypothetical protein
MYFLFKDMFGGEFYTLWRSRERAEENCVQRHRSSNKHGMFEELQRTVMA